MSFLVAVATATLLVGLIGAAKDTLRHRSSHVSWALITIGVMLLGLPVTRFVDSKFREAPTGLTSVSG